LFQCDILDIKKKIENGINKHAQDTPNENLAIANFIDNRNRFLYALVAQKGSFNLTQLHPESSDFNLVVQSSIEFNIPIWQEPP
jgi:hypothetical protein